MSPELLQVDRAGTKLAVLDPKAGKVALLPIDGGPPQPLQGMEDARYAAFDSRGRLLVAHGARVSIVDTNGQPSAELTVDPLDGPITHVATDPGGEYAFAVQGERGVLSIFYLRSGGRPTVLRMPAPLGRSLPSADSQFVLIPVGDHAVSIVSNWTRKERGRIKVAGRVRSIGLAVFQSVAAIAVGPGRQLVLYDLRDRHLLADLRLPGTPEFGAPSPDGMKYYIALPDLGKIAVVEFTRRPTVRLIDNVGVGAWAVVSAMGDSYCH